MSIFTPKVQTRSSSNENPVSQSKKPHSYVPFRPNHLVQFKKYGARWYLAAIAKNCFRYLELHKFHSLSRWWKKTKEITVCDTVELAMLPRIYCGALKRKALERCRNEKVKHPDTYGATQWITPACPKRSHGMDAFVKRKISHII